MKHLAKLLGMAAALLLWQAEAVAAGFTLNLKGADLRTLVETVSEATGKNFIVDPSVTGKVTVVSGKPMSGDELYQVFLSILEVHGFIAVPNGNAIKIVPNDKIRFAETPVVTDQELKIPGQGNDEAMVRVFELKNVDSNQLIPVLRPMVSPKGHLAVYPPTNMLIVSEYAGNIERLARIIQRVDQPTTGDTEVIPLEHASAHDLVEVLNTMEKEAATRAGKKPNPPILAVDERTNSLLLSGDQIDRLRMRALVTHLDTPVDIIGNTQVVYLNYAKAATLVKVLASIGENYQNKATTPATGLKPSPGSTTSATSASAASAMTSSNNPNSLVNVQAYEGANALVITAPAPLLRTMEAVIRKLDTRRAQVQVEAIIAEISTDKVAELGVQWRNLPSGSGPFMGTNFNNSSQGINQLSGSTSGVPNILGVGGGLSMGFVDGTGSILGNEFLNLNMLLRILNQKGVGNVLQTPSIVTLDNEEAQIVVAETIPFVTGSFTASANSATNPFQTITRENVGLVLKVNPQITQGDAIRLDINQELSEVKNTPTLGADGVVTNTRSIKTAVMVDDGQLLILGGLIRNKQQLQTDKVPLLGDVPVLGNLFRYQSNSDAKTNLMVFLRPQILRNAQEGLNLTYDRYNFLRGRMQNPNYPTGYMGLDEKPLQLPEIGDYNRRGSPTGGPVSMGPRGTQPPPLIKGSAVAPPTALPQAPKAPQPKVGWQPATEDGVKDYPDY
ncbi:MAG: type II secretion system secretin GspD [Magnetococcales bacterium]|nr:type II secretion system secretin GspD [Magnetococcales bacterium]